MDATIAPRAGELRLKEELEAVRRGALDMLQVHEMQLSEAATHIGIVERERVGAQTQARHWKSKALAATAAAVTAEEMRDTAERAATLSNRETRAADFRCLHLQRQLALLADVVPRVQCDSMCDAYKAKVAEQAELIRALNEQLAARETLEYGE